MLPCNVIVYEGDDGKAVVTAIDPMQTVAANEKLAPVAREVRDRLSRVLEKVRRIRARLPPEEQGPGVRRATSGPPFRGRAASPISVPFRTLTCTARYRSAQARREKLTESRGILRGTLFALGLAWPHLAAKGLLGEGAST